MQIWPPDYKAEYLKRVSLMEQASYSLDLQNALNVHYSKNPIDWINDWCVTYDPRSKGLKVMPFILFQRQKDFVQFLMACLDDKEAGLVEKSRDIGATWVACAFSVWLLLFVPGASIGWGSRKEMLIDRLGDPDSIFQKMRMILDHLPGWMLPKDFNIGQHATYMKIVNPQNSSTITGEAGDSIGRGGRSMIYFKDESAHYERPELIESSLGDNTDVQIDISSVHGTANVFYRRRNSGEVWYPDKKPTPGKTRVFIFDWRDHPGKTQEWYDARRKKAEDEGLLNILAQEVDRDYSASIDRIIIPPQWIRAAIDAHIKLGFGPDGEKVAALDVADEGGDKNAIIIRHGVIFQYAEHWGEGDTGQTARKAVSKASEFSCNQLYYDCIGVGAGVKSETNRLRGEGDIINTLQVLPWNAAEGPENPTAFLIEEEIHSPRNEDFFLNRKAQAWWNMRVRFEKTYKAVTHGIKYDPADLISIPSDLPHRHELEQELSQAQQKQNNKGKMLVDKRPDGAKSPNLADAAIMCFSPANSYEGGIGYLAFLGEQARKKEAQRPAN